MCVGANVRLHPPVFFLRFSVVVGPRKEIRL